MRQKRLKGKYKRLNGLIVLSRVYNRIASDNSNMDGDPKHFYTISGNVLEMR
ncbi:MAG TPA: hypothetical protein VF199_02995 [Bacillales bacterium]